MTSKGKQGRRSFDRIDRKLREIKRRVEGFRLEELPVATLDAMDGEIEARQAELLQEAQAYEQRIEEEMAAGHGLVIGELRRRVRQAFQDHREMEQERQKVYNARQQRILEDRLIALLGSKARVKALEWLILVLIVGVVGMLVYDLATPGLSDSTRLTINLIDVGACLVFLAEFFLRHHYAESKRWYWRRHWIDFITSIPLPMLPNAQLVRFGRLARLARLTRLVRLVRILRILRVIFFFWRGMDKLQDVLDVRLFKRSLAITVAMLIAGGLLIFFCEHGAADVEGVDTLGESIWWSFTTVVTGGFGDIHNPLTPAGRCVTVLLVIAGMTVVGIFTATLTSVLVGDESERLLDNQDTIMKRLDALDTALRSVATEVGVALPEKDEDKGS